MPLQVVKRIVMVVSRWRWVADGGAVLLGNAIEGFHGGAVLLRNASGGCQTHCNHNYKRRVADDAAVSLGNSIEELEISKGN